MERIDTTMNQMTAPNIFISNIPILPVLSSKFLIQLSNVMKSLYQWNIFKESVIFYEIKLNKTGYNTKTKVTLLISEKVYQGNSKKKDLIQPPLNKNVSKNNGKFFLNLVSKHFLCKHEFHEMFNRNTIKIRYSCRADPKILKRKECYISAIMVGRQRISGLRWSKKAKITSETISFWWNISISILKFSPFFIYNKSCRWNLINFLKFAKALMRKEKTTHAAVNGKRKT